MELFIILTVIGVCSGVTLLIGIRICPFYNLLKIPCPGCGLTRSVFALLQLDFAKSIKYHILGIPLVVIVLFYFALVIYAKVTQKKITLLDSKTKPFVIGIAILLLIISWIRNLNNPLLY